MVQFKLFATTSAKETNIITVHMEKPPLAGVQIHQAELILNAEEAILLRDQLKIAIHKLIQD